MDVGLVEARGHVTLWLDDPAEEWEAGGGGGGGGGAVGVDERRGVGRGGQMVARCLMRTAGLELSKNN